MNALKNIITKDYLKIVEEFKVEQKNSDDILKELESSIGEIDFKLLAFPATIKLEERLCDIKTKLKKGKDETLETEAEAIIKKLSGFKLQKKHYLVDCIGQLLKIAEANKWGLCKKDGFIFLFNGAYWIELNKESFQYFLGNVALKMGVEKYNAKMHTFKDELHKQFLAEAHLDTPKINKGNVLINLNNGTFEITPYGKKLRPYKREDFLTHMLPFPYDPEAEAPIFKRYLNEVLPDKNKQKVLAEFIGYVFTKGLKKEKELSAN